MFSPNIQNFTEALIFFFYQSKNILNIPKCDMMNNSWLLRLGHPSEPESSKVNALSTVMTVWSSWWIISTHSIKALDSIFFFFQMHSLNHTKIKGKESVLRHTECHGSDWDGLCSLKDLIWYSSCTLLTENWFDSSCVVS